MYASLERLPQLRLHRGRRLRSRRGHPQGRRGLHPVLRRGGHARRARCHPAARRQRLHQRLSRPDGCCATRSSTRSARAPRRSAACSSAASSSENRCERRPAHGRPRAPSVRAARRSSRLPADRQPHRAAHRRPGAARPAMRCPRRRDLARQFGVNRSTVREAIRELETHGLLGRGRGEKRLRVTRPRARAREHGREPGARAARRDLSRAVGGDDGHRAGGGAIRGRAPHARAAAGARAHGRPLRARGAADTGEAVAAVVGFLHDGGGRERQPGARAVAGAASTCCSRPP